MKNKQFRCQISENKESKKRDITIFSSGCENQME